MSYGITIHLKEIKKDDFFSEVSKMVEEFNSLNNMNNLIRSSYSLYNLFCKSERENFVISKEQFIVSISKTFRCGFYLWEDLGLIGVVASDFLFDILKDNGYYKQYFQNSVDKDYTLDDYSNMPFIKNIYDSFIVKNIEDIANELIKVSNRYDSFEKISDYFSIYEEYSEESYIKRTMINEYIEELLSIQDIIYSNVKELNEKNIKCIFNNSFYPEMYDKFFESFNELLTKGDFFYN